MTPIIIIGNILLIAVTSYGIPYWASRRIVYTVFDMNNTWNEARQICHLNGMQLLSMEDINAWDMWKLLLIPTENLPRRQYELRYWMGLHAKDPTNLTDLYLDNCSHPTFLEWTRDRPLYVIDDPCVLFDVYWKPFTSLLLKYWIGQPCTNKHYFVCERYMDDLPCVQSCEESVYLHPTTSAECAALCSSIGGGCIHRFLTLTDMTVCHLIKPSASTNTASYHNICYFPGLYGGLTYCDPPGIYNSSFEVDNRTIAGNMCSDTTSVSSQQSTSQTLTSTQTSTETTFSSATTEQLCECPCAAKDTSTGAPLTLEQKVQKLKKELTVSKKNTSLHKRSLISVSDPRVSATSIGSVGVAILVFLLTSICVMDMGRIKCKRLARKCCPKKGTSNITNTPQTPEDQVFGSNKFQCDETNIRSESRTYNTCKSSNNSESVKDNIANSTDSKSPSSDREYNDGRYSQTGRNETSWAEIF